MYCGRRVLRNMSEELMTKKELLDMFGISYGALYRWKRKNLIPDSWFIHKSTTTGQETFLPRDRVIERVETIMKLKDTMSLDEIAESFVPGRSENILERDEIIARKIADGEQIDRFAEMCGKDPPYTWKYLITLAIFVRCGDFRGAVCAADCIEKYGSELIMYIAESDSGKIRFCLSHTQNDRTPIFEDGCCVCKYQLADIINDLNRKLK